MIGSLLRPLTSGLQDERIQYNVHKDRCKIHPYLKVFVRAGRMTTQWVRLDFNQVADFGRQTTCDLVRKGHFINRVFLVCTLPALTTTNKITGAPLPTGALPKFGYTNGIGHALIARTDFTISGETVDTLDSQLLEVLDEYYTPLEKVPAVNELIGRYDNGFTNTSIQGPITTYTPLPFWFSRGDSSAALPIDAMPADQLQIRVQFRGIQGCYQTTSLSRLPNSPDPCDPSTEGSSLWNISESSFYVEDTGGILVPGLNPSSPNTKYSQLENYAMPLKSDIHIQDAYLLCEYIYVDKPEANRFRVADIRVPVVQHYIVEPFDNKEQAFASIPVRIPNPCRALYMVPQRYEVPAYNAYFLCTRDLTTTYNQQNNIDEIWWPNAQGLQAASVPSKFIPGFATRDSEPLAALSFVYEGQLARYATTAPALFRSVLIGPMFTKTPWINRYMYALPFGLFPGMKPLTLHFGEANLDKLKRAELRLQFSPKRGCTDPMTVDRYTVRIYAETYNVFRVYGGRGTLLFSY
jgi:hypothetical protein